MSPIFRVGDQTPPPPKRITDVVVERFEHVYEVDPAKMQTFPQQDLPAWDTHRIVAARWDHLAWMHKHFADDVLVAGLPSETMPTEGNRSHSAEPSARDQTEEAG